MDINERNIILASRSPRRKELLENIGLKFSIKAAEIDETHANLSDFGEIVKDLAKQKACAVRPLLPEKCMIISSDTIVVIKGIILNKPDGRNNAFDMLKLLAGKVHSVFTSLYVNDAYLNKTVSGFTETKVEFYPMTDDQINSYLDTREPFDKAGAYGIQGYGSKFIKRIDGCFFSVMGFPIPLFSQKMYKMGYNL